MKKRFDVIHSVTFVTELILLAGTLFLLISSAISLLFKLFLPGTLYPTVIIVLSLVGISLYLLPKVKPDDNWQHIEIDTDEKTMSVRGRNVGKSNVIDVLRFDKRTNDRFVIKFPSGISIDSRTCKDPDRLLNLLPKVFPDSDIRYHQTASMVKMFVFIGLIASLAMFITVMII